MCRASPISHCLLTFSVRCLPVPVSCRASVCTGGPGHARGPLTLQPRVPQRVCPRRQEAHRSAAHQRRHHWCVLCAAGCAALPACVQQAVCAASPASQLLNAAAQCCLRRRHLRHHRLRHLFSPLSACLSVCPVPPQARHLACRPAPSHQTPSSPSCAPWPRTRRSQVTVHAAAADSGTHACVRVHARSHCARPAR